MFSLLSDAWSDRQKSPPAPAGHLVMLIFLLVLVCILIAAFSPPQGFERDYHFSQEEGAMTFVSATMLFLASVFSFCAVVKLIGSGSGRLLLCWLVLGAGFSFLVVDELFELHEKVGWHLDQWIGSGPFRTWNDVVVILYAPPALLVAVTLLPRLLRYRRLPELFALGFTFYAAHTVIDTLSDPQTVVSMIAEESCKVFSTTCLMTGVLSGFLQISKLPKKSAAQNRAAPRK